MPRVSRLLDRPLPLMRRLARATLLTAIALSGPFAAHALAQGAPAPSLGAPPSGAPEGGFRSGGINAVITSVSPTQTGIVIQFLIQNNRRTGIYIAPIVSRGGSGAMAFSSKGTQYYINNPNGDVMGISPCVGDQGDFGRSITACLKGFPTDTMTYLDPDQTTVLGITYFKNNNTPGGDPGDSVNFALKFLVRNAPAQSDSLSAAGGGSAAAGPPAVVTISFPLVPIRNGA